MKQYIVGKYIISRGNYSGVVFGKVVDCSDDYKVVVLTDAVALLDWKSEIGSGHIVAAINRTTHSMNFEKCPCDMILTENYQVMLATDEQVKIIQSNAKDIK